MPDKTRPPTRAALAARATLASDDQFADRVVRQRASDHQQEPQGDNRYRVERSTRFYVVQLIGTWVNVVESAERTVRSRNNLRWVTFENKEYELRKAATLKPFLTRFVQGGCYAYVGGKLVERERELGFIDPHPFIYIASTAALRTFNEMRKNKLARKRH
jgi:hypothetical protein